MLLIIIALSKKWKEGVCAHFALECARFALWMKSNERKCFVSFHIKRCGIFCIENVEVYIEMPLSLKQNEKVCME